MSPKSNYQSGTTLLDKKELDNAPVIVPTERLVKTHNSFDEDLKNFVDGTVPQSVVAATVIGVVCGIAANIYYKVLYSALNFIWHDFPMKVFEGHLPEFLCTLWIPIVGYGMAYLSGLTVKHMGEPGDLAYTIKCVHEKGYISMDHVLPMVCASQFGILGGGSLGPEAPLVAVCAALGGYVSRVILKRTDRNIIRKHTLMGMAGALAAFFGCPLGGSLFALEVNSRFGVEYFEHMVESIICGEITLCVFRSLAGLPIAPIWTISSTKLVNATTNDVVVGAIIGLIGAGIAAIFKKFHMIVMAELKQRELLNEADAPKRALLGATIVVILGMFIPQTMFWGEYEFQTISTMSPTNTLEHIWPNRSIIGFQMNNGFTCLLVAFGKLIAISCTVAGGYRGGFIFPFFASGAAFGRAFCTILPSVPVSLSCLSFAAAINVGITRTSLASPIILCFLAGEPNAMSGVLAASLVSLVATTYMPFIVTQQPREDMQHQCIFPNMGASSNSGLDAESEMDHVTVDEEKSLL